MRKRIFSIDERGEEDYIGGDEMRETPLGEAEIRCIGQVKRLIELLVQQICDSVNFLPAPIKFFARAIFDH